MASELRVDTLKDSSGSNSVGMAYVSNGSAKAWVNFDGTGTIAARNSLNVSSLTDNGIGDYDVNISSSFTAADYSINVSLYPSASWNQQPSIQNPANNTSGLFSIFSASTSGTKNDTQLLTASTHGDLA
jgi:hypothetical protein